MPIYRFIYTFYIQEAGSVRFHKKREGEFIAFFLDTSEEETSLLPLPRSHFQLVHVSIPPKSIHNSFFIAHSHLIGKM